jgi:two-component system LytT family response regulator
VAQIWIGADKPAARRRLRRLLSAHREIDVVAEAASAEEALLAAEQLEFDVLFTDIQMPGASGLDLVASWRDPAPAIVFVTAYDRYALDAFDAAAVDYLLKPVEADRLARAVTRLQRVTAGTTRVALPAPPPQLLIPDRGRTHVVAVADILWLEAADNYVAVHTAGRAPLLRRTLAGLVADLGTGFMRVHRSAAVALAHVVEVRTTVGGDAQVLLRGGQQAPCSRQHRAALLARLDDHQKR